MKNLNFEDLMEIFLKSKKEKDYEEILNVNQEFARRVTKRKLMGKKPMKTSTSGLKQTQLWLDSNTELAIKNNQETSKQRQKNKLNKLRNKTLRVDTDVNKKNTLW